MKQPLRCFYISVILQRVRETGSPVQSREVTSARSHHVACQSTMHHFPYRLRSLDFREHLKFLVQTGQLMCIPTSVVDASMIASSVQKNAVSMVLRRCRIPQNVW